VRRGEFFTGLFADQTMLPMPSAPTLPMIGHVTGSKLATRPDQSPEP